MVHETFFWVISRTDNQGFHHVSPNFSISPDDSPDQTVDRISSSHSQYCNDSPQTTRTVIDCDEKAGDSTESTGGDEEMEEDSSGDLEMVVGQDMLIWLPESRLLGWSHSREVSLIVIIKVRSQPPPGLIIKDLDNQGRKFSDYQIVRSMVESMYQYFDSDLSESHQAKLYICTLLDPRFKNHNMWLTHKYVPNTQLCTECV